MKNGAHGARCLARRALLLRALCGEHPLGPRGADAVELAGIAEHRRLLQRVAGLLHRGGAVGRCR